MRAGSGVLHGAKLDDEERLLELASALLEEKSRSRAGKTDSDGGEEKKRAEEKKAKRGSDGIKGTFAEARVESGGHCVSVSFFGEGVASHWACC